jgi:NADP-dependent 3-hydroxy-3-methylglutaryl-CoA reductase
MKYQKIPQAKTNGKTAFRAISRVPERGFHTEKSRKRRCQFLQKKTGVDLTTLTPHQLISCNLKNNIEAFVGAVELPVGVAGPLHLIGSDFEEMVFAPIATSEGALVASISRGAYAINLCGGVQVRFIKQRMNRVPVFHFKSMADAYSFSVWSQKKLDQLKSIVKRYSCVADLESISPRIVSKSVNLNFSYQTGDAAGQNMSTTCTWHACQWLKKQWNNETAIPLESFSIEGNGSCDKKVSFTNFHEGRGCEAVAECTIPSKILKRVLKVTPQEFYDSYQSALNQSFTLGMIGFNINVSNLIAGIFAATGQDIACVHESSLAHLSVELIGDDLYSSLHLPSLVIGTIGGGTHLPVQRKLLELLGCNGSGKIQRFAEIIAGFSLALELSTGAAVAGGQFAMAHEKYGRNRPVDWLKLGELEEKILPDVLGNYLKETPLDLVIKQNREFHVGDNILSELCKNNYKKNIGLFPYDLSYKSGDGRKTLKSMVKLKALDTEIHQVGIKMAAMGSMELANLFKRFALKTGFTNCHKKELAICQQVHKRFTDHVPQTYCTVMDEKREIYLLVNKRQENTLLRNSADNVNGWQETHIKEVLTSAASFHSLWYDKDHLPLEKDYFVDKRLKTEDYYEMTPFFLALLDNARNEFPEIVTQEHFNTISQIITRLDSWVPSYSKYPATLIHNDFNPRNIMFENRKPAPKAIIYDWELACIAIPQRDIAEFLCFVLEKDVGLDTFNGYVEMYRKELEFLINRKLDRSEWLNGFQYALYDFIIGRLMMYLMAHTFKDYKFMIRVFDTSMSLVNKLENEPCTT